MTSRVLLSGGLDSTLCLILALRESDDVEAVACDYGQRHKRELGQAVLIAQVLGAPLHIKRGLDVGRGRLTGDAGELDSQGAVMPGRNRALLRAAVEADNRFANEVWIGATADDQAVFEDCRPEFFAQIEDEWGVRVRAPLIDKTKADIVRLYREYGASAMMVYTYSCYRGEELACGHCGACSARVRGFHAAGVKDPGAYADRRLLSPCPRCKLLGEPTPPGMRCHGCGGFCDSHRERPVG